MAEQVRGGSSVDTYGAILDLIRSRGEVSRTELADRSGLTSPSITRIVRQLLADGLIVETGVGDFTGGKRRTMLQLNPSARQAVGISIDNVSITYLLADLGGRIRLRKKTKGTGSGTPQAVTQRVAAELRSLLESADLGPDTLLGLGVATSGIQDNRAHGLRSDRHARQWERFPLADLLTETTGHRVVTENDATCAAIGEFWVGRVPASKNFATAYMTSGFGLGLMIHGEVFRGASSNVGEIGHLVLDVNGPPCSCGRRGCLEAVAGAGAVVRRALDTPGLAEDLGLGGTARTLRRDFDRLTTAAAAGHQPAYRLIKESADQLASALVSLTNVLDLDQIILAGPGYGAASALYADAAAEQLQSGAFARQVHVPGVSVSAMGADAAALGAASLVLHSQLSARPTGSR